MISRYLLMVIVSLEIAACNRAPGGTAKAPRSDSLPGMPGMKGMPEMKGMAGTAGMPASQPGTVRLTADQIRRFGVTFGIVEQRPLAAQVRTVGTVMADETRLSQVVPKVGGYVERLYVNQTGQRVRLGDPLVAVYSPDVVAAEGELLVAARLDRASGDSATPSSLVDAGKQRLRAWDVSEEQIARVLRTGTPERTVTFDAPVSGVVMDKKVVQGQAIQPGDMLLSVADLSEVWVTAEVREADAASVRIGSRATIELTAYPWPHVHGSREFRLSDRAGRGEIRRRAHHRPRIPDDLLKPGMYATVAFMEPARMSPLGTGIGDPQYW